MAPLASIAHPARFSPSWLTSAGCPRPAAIVSGSRGLTRTALATPVISAACWPKDCRGRHGRPRATWPTSGRGTSVRGGFGPAGAARLISSSAPAGARYRRAYQKPQRVDVHEGMQFRDPTKDNNVGPDKQLKWGTFDHRQWHKIQHGKRLDFGEVKDTETRRRAQAQLARLHSPVYDSMTEKMQDFDGVEDHGDEPNKRQWDAWRFAWNERRYLRKSLYELPKLKEFQKEFVPPTERHFLKFSTHYNPTDRSSQRARNVKLEVKISQLGLNKAQLHKFLLLIGEHYNPQNQTFYLQTWRYTHVAQNKKWLSDVMDDLLKETLDPTDDFSDVPLCSKLVAQWYHPPKLNFPDAWKKPLQKVTADDLVLARSIWERHCQENMSAVAPTELVSGTT